MSEPLSDVVNDISDDSGEPSYVGVAICTGSDLNAQPITLVDRLCINRAGVIQISDDMKICEQNAAAFRRDVAIQEIQKQSEKRESDAYAFGFVFFAAMFFIAIASHFWRSIDK